MIQKLISKIEKTHAPIVVGLDPMLNYIPKQIQEKAFKEYGKTDWEPLSTLPAVSSPHGSRRNMRSMARLLSQRHPELL